MVIHGRMQRIGFRIGDVVCSLIAFTCARETLLPAKDVLQQVLSGYFPNTGDLAAGLADRQVPGWQGLLWILIVAGLSMNVTQESGSDAEPVAKRTYHGIILLQLAATCVAAGVIAIVGQAFSIPVYSRLFVISYLIYLFVLSSGFRIAAKLYTKRYGKGLVRRRIVLAGRADGIASFLSKTSDITDPHVDLIGCLLDDESKPNSLPVPVVGSVNSLGDLLIHQPIDEVVLVLPPAETPWVAAALEHCDYFRVSVHIINESLMGVKLNDLMATSGIQPFAAITLRPEEELSSDWLVFKRVIDIIGSAAALIVLAPLMLLIAIAIKVTTPRLPVLYKWHVVGYRGRRFTGYKFTTMVADADAQKETLSKLNEMSGPVFKIKNDPRVNPLGRFLRKYSLNELPQFWSVLTGDMSLVGPRPAGPHELVKYAQWHKRKLSVRPGITCFWQVRGRNAISNFDDWVKMDLEYIQKRSVRTDMSILVQTVTAVVRGTGS